MRSTKPGHEVRNFQDAIIGGFIGSLLFGWDVTGFNIGSILVATLGAIILIAILRAIPGAQPLE